MYHRDGSGRIWRWAGVREPVSRGAPAIIREALVGSWVKMVAVGKEVREKLGSGCPGVQLR